MLSLTQVPDGRATPFAYGTITRCGRPFQVVRLDVTLVTPMRPVLQPHGDESPWFRLVRVRSPLLTESRFLSLPPGTEMFQFPGLAPHAYGFSVR